MNIHIFLLTKFSNPLTPACVRYFGIVASFLVGVGRHPLNVVALILGHMSSAFAATFPTLWHQYCQFSQVSACLNNLDRTTLLLSACNDALVYCSHTSPPMVICCLPPSHAYSCNASICINMRHLASFSKPHIFITHFMSFAHNKTWFAYFALVLAF